MGASGYRGKLTVQRIMEQEYENDGCVVKYVSVKSDSSSNWPTETYVARRLSSGQVICEVVLSEYQDGKTWVKVIDETMGPAVDQCPDTILRLLTPIESETANSWRKRCAVRNKQTREIRAMMRELTKHLKATQ